MAPSVDLQEMVNGLAARLGRSVAIDDRQIRLIVASRHFGDEDAVRVQSVMDRGVSAELISSIAPFSLDELEEPTRIEGREDLGFKPRWCFPIRWNDVLMGFLWLIDDERLTEQDRAAAATMAESVGVILYRFDAAFERRQAGLDAIMRDLLSAEPSVRTAAIAEIEQEGMLSETRSIVIASLGVTGTEQEGELEAALLLGSRELLASMPARSVLTQARRRGLTMLFAGVGETDEVREPIDRIARDIRAATGGGVVVGIGGRQVVLSDARVSYDQARIAARVAGTLPAFGPVARWGELGVYALLGHLTPQHISLANYPPSLLRLTDSRSAEQLLETAESYLDHAGDAQRTAKALHIHRATLYQRLARIEELSGLSMKTGTDRLTLHLGIKLARLSGQYESLVERARES